MGSKHLRFQTNLPILPDNPPKSPSAGPNNAIQPPPHHGAAKPPDATEATRTSAAKEPKTEEHPGLPTTIRSNVPKLIVSSLAARKSQEDSNRSAGRFNVCVGGRIRGNYKASTESHCITHRWSLSSASHSQHIKGRESRVADNPHTTSCLNTAPTYRLSLEWEGKVP
ncbi:hypothetical protein CRM22_008699 [Opisthorchis felineus]|uniref:Uncharacterized protein n=1 Tax=Opisthorchis felineus TaxID=147828 RepID=A0A4S2LAT3_OPIFE|nr:hypothetical protein CRM22_008699 [Opisthorchis felineus]